MCGIHWILKEGRGVGLLRGPEEDGVGWEVGRKAVLSGSMCTVAHCGWGGAPSRPTEQAESGWLWRNVILGESFLLESLKDNQISWHLGAKIWQIIVIIRIMLRFAVKIQFPNLAHSSLSLVQGALQFYNPHSVWRVWRRLETGLQCKV